jgi:hypothetical protein
MIGMKKIASIGLIISVSLLLLVTTTTGAQAKATKTAFEYNASPGDIVDFGVTSVRDGTVHIRGYVFQWVCYAGDMTGVMTITANVNINTKTGKSCGWGTWAIDVTGGDLGFTGTAEGTYTGKGDNAEGIGWGVAGDLEGLKIDCFSYPNPDIDGEAIFGGILLNPHG